MRDEPRQMASKCWIAPDFELGFHHFQYSAEDLNCFPHTHGEYNVTLCLNRTIEYIVNGRLEGLEAGDLLVINPGEIHQGRYGTNQTASRGITFYLTERALKNLLHEMHIFCDRKAQNIKFLGKVHDPKILRLAQDLLDELEQRRKGYEIVLRSCMLQILVYLFRNCFEPTVAETGSELPGQLPSWQMVAAIEYMNTCGKSDFSLIEMCSKIGTSPARFIRLFKNSTGMVSPHVYYNRLLIDKAGRLLRTGQHSIKEVAYELGFKNDGHFCMVFRRISGMTPKNYQLLQSRQCDSIANTT